MMREEWAISAQGLGRRFGRHWALAHVDLTARAGEVLLLAGANGSGKTTLLRILAGLSPPTLGSLRLFGHNPKTERFASRRLVTMVAHQNYLYDRLSALEMLHTWSRLLGRRTGDDELVALLGEVGLGERAHDLIGQFSAGMRKRLSLLRTRLEAPRLVLLDEPFAALDPPGQSLVEGWIEAFRTRGTTVVMASHSIVRASRLCQRALLLDRGQVAWQGPAASLPAQLGPAL